MIIHPIAIIAIRHSGKWASLFERVSYASFALPGIVVALAFVFAGINEFVHVVSRQRVVVLHRSISMAPRLS